MTFTQPAFFLFILCFYLGWRLFETHSNLRLAYLVLASLIFYSFGDWRPALLLLAIGMTGYLGGIGLDKLARFRMPILALAVSVSIGLLLVTKYSGFALDNARAGLGLLGIHFEPDPILYGFSRMPTLGISFYTLQAIGYLLDCYHGRIKPAANPLHYFAFLAMFPKLIAGPIERGKHLLPQLAAEPVLPTEQQRWDGTRLIIYGYFAKAVIADNLAPFVDSAFNALAVRQNTGYWWLVMAAFAVQLYCDFSGYSAIAVGLGKWMGFDLTQNFNHPYLSTSLAEFWTRWHISLSNWLRDTIFFPLSRSRIGRGRPYLNLWITFLVSGLWHGAGWTFILWGGLHAAFNSLERLTQWPNLLKRFRWGRWAALTLVLIQVCPAWVLFRAASLPQAWEIYQTLFSYKTAPIPGGLDPGVWLILALGLLREVYALFPIDRKITIPARLKNGLEVAGLSILVTACILFRGPGSQFIYFQF